MVRSLDGWGFLFWNLGLAVVGGGFFVTFDKAQGMPVLYFLCFNKQTSSTIIVLIAVHHALLS